MKRKTISSILALVALSNLNVQLSTAFAQGALTPPPGAPAPVMKSLDQIEARIPLNTVPGASNAVHVISQPGNYYLTANVVGSAGKNGILINADDVSIDLNGYTILGSGAGSLDAIAVLNPDGGDGDRLSVRNGSIREWGGAAISIYSHYVQALEDLNISNCGYGIGCYGAAMVRRCHLVNTGKSGIYLTTAISRVQDCTVSGVSRSDGPAYGISVYFGTVENCLVHGMYGAPATGIRVEWAVGSVSRSTANQIHSYTGSGCGIDATTVTDCMATYISANSANSTGIIGNQVERCTVAKISTAAGSGKAAGILMSRGAGLIAHCTLEDISGYHAYGMDVLTNSSRITASQLNNIAAKGGGAYGINADTGANLNVAGCSITTVTNSGTQTRGILVQGGLIENCSIAQVQSVGIYVNGKTSIINCRVHSVRGTSTTAAYLIGSSGSRLSGNLATDSDLGFHVLGGGGGNHLIGNSARGNNTNYYVLGGNVAPLLNAAGVAAATNPFANLDL
jgi:parallel beta-helix repeat protein